MSQPFGPYTLEKKIADGGMAEVFLATKRGAGGWEKTVVVKKILPPFADREEFRKMLLKEASIVTNLSHPNIVQIFDYFEYDDDLCIVEEHVPGKNLREIILGLEAGIGWVAVSYIACELLDALTYLHELETPVLHRDISPSNVMLSRGGAIKLIDFGLSRCVVDDESFIGLKGKPGFMAPEYLRERRYSAVSEIYAVGALLLEALRGKCLLEHDQGHRLYQLNQIQNGPCPAKLVQIIAKALEEEPNNRFASAATMRQQVYSLLGSKGLTLEDGKAALLATVKAVFVRRPESGYLPLHKTQLQTPTQQQSPVRIGVPWALGLMAAMVVTFFPWSLSDSSIPAFFGVATAHPPLAVEVKAQKPDGIGFLNIDSHPWSSIYLNGRYLGVTPLRQFGVRQGDYLLHLITPEGGLLERRLTLQSGENLELFESLR